MTFSASTALGDRPYEHALSAGVVGLVDAGKQRFEIGMVIVRDAEHLALDAPFERSRPWTWFCLPLLRWYVQSMVPALLAGLPSTALWIVADNGYSSDDFRKIILRQGNLRVISIKINEAAISYTDWILSNRNMVEWLRAKLKEWRAVATRYEKIATSYLGVLNLAATLDWLKR